MKRVFMGFSIGSVMLGCACAGSLFLLCAGVVYPIEFIFTLATGWVTFLIRVVPQVEADVGSIVLGCSAFGLFVVGLHVLLRYFYASYQRRDVAALAHTQDTWEKKPESADTFATASLDQPWRLRWTISFSSVVLLMFIAGIAFVGITHQTIWLVTSPEPLLESN